jgi:F-box and leucine-rich repeat protein 14
LNLKGCQKISPKGIQDISCISTLEVLNLSQCIKLDDGINKPLSHLTKLVYLNLRWNEKITHLKCLKELKNLRTLDIGGLIQLREIHFHHCESLTSLNISKLNLNPNQLEKSFEKLTQLKFLDLSFCPFSNETIMRMLKNLKELMDVNLTKTIIEDSTLEFLSTLSFLQTLSISSCKYITDEGFQWFQGKFKQLSSLNVSFMKHISVGFQHVFHLKLSILDVKGSISMENISNFENLQNLKVSLEALYSNFNYLNQEFCDSICSLKSLQNLDISNTNVSDENLKHFQKLKQLKK